MENVSYIGAMFYGLIIGVLFAVGGIVGFVLLLKWLV